MGTVRLKNKQNAPLALELGAGKGLHLQALEELEVDEAILKSEQVKAAIAAGYLRVISVKKEESSESKAKKGSDK
ncbi:hypothetical protein [Thermoanaerobacterium sp. DL9XJH110]|uniref:hypothetical protein n=1 Tax=Thermoanaerobacterium sp. DL9XJH110 TaxID=3386643 RepID=UPI003BB50CBB